MFAKKQATLDNHRQTVGDKIRLNCQGWEDVKVLNPRQALLVVAINGQLYLLPAHRPAKFETSIMMGWPKRATGPTTSNKSRRCWPHVRRGWL
jgi:hypothetical protein